MGERRDIVVGQRVREEKALLARKFRREMTSAEAVFWDCARAHRLAGLKFRRQQVIDGFVADFYCADLGLVVELDGSAHDGRAEADADRDRVFIARGLTVLRFPNARIEADLPAVLAEIAAHRPRE